MAGACLERRPGGCLGGGEIARSQLGGRQRRQQVGVVRLQGQGAARDGRSLGGAARICQRGGQAFGHHDPVFDVADGNQRRGQLVFVNGAREIAAVLVRTRQRGVRAPVRQI